MSNAQYTPGPWKAFIPDIGGDELNADGNNYWEIVSEEFHSGAKYLNITSWTSEANAKLIAAAPDMAEAGIKLNRQLFNLASQLPNDDELIKSILELRNALLKAGVL
jgi:hypothetical protein